ncbi:MAG TPA: hypothetical protein VGY58_24030 [Gemmataceae bacterium]|nr:hypothetical protein [Gemmataceae bacterium]
MKLSWYDDRGSLDWARQGLVFSGRIGVVSMPQIRTVQPPSLIVPWGAFASLVLGNVLVLLMFKAGAFQILTLDNPVTCIALVLLNAMVPCCWPMRWVRVEYLDAQGEYREAYFTPASIMTRWSGGTKRLHGWITEHIVGQ